MKNLAGVKECDATIREELYLAGIKQVPAEAKGEVPYTIEGKIGNWRFQRAWYYWIASVEVLTDGLPLELALELHNKPNPINPDNIMGMSIRSGGHGSGPSPDEYGANPDYDDADFNNQLKALGYKEEYWKILNKSYINITVGEVSQLCKEGKLKVDRYVTCYHIDDQIGLNEFVRHVNEHYLTALI